MTDKNSPDLSAMLAEQELSVKDKLNLETGKISWKELEIFFAKGSLLIVEPKQDLLKAAESIAANNQDEVEEMITSKAISFATPAWAKEFCSDNPDLWAVVIAPYVVAQLVE